jgi:hypothetical protein
VTEVDSRALTDLVDTLTTVIDQFAEEHPDTLVDEVAAAVNYVASSMFRLASEIPPSKLH